MKTLRPSIRFAAVLATATLLAATAPADDLTVANGSSQTISSSVTYGAVKVNGDLTVAPNVTLKCSSLTVSDNIGSGKTARLFVGNGATVEVSGDYYNSTKIGVKAGRAEVHLGTGATLNVQNGFLNVCWGYDGTTTSPMSQAIIVVGTNAYVRCHADLCFGHNGNRNNYQPNSVGPSTICSQVLLEPGSRISCQRISPWQQVGQKIIFNGGRIVQDPSPGYTSGFIAGSYNAGQHDMYLEGTNGCPVHLELKSRNKHACLYEHGGKMWSTVRISGDGGFLKTGAGDFPICAERNDSEPIHFQCTGDVVIREGGLSVAQNNAVHTLFRSTVDTGNRPVDLVVECGAKFDLAGSDVALNSIKAMGVVTNAAATTKTMTLGVLDDGRDSYLARVPAGVAFVKQGASSSLTLCANDIASLNVQGGTLILKDRATMGYPLYRFKFDSSEMDLDLNLNNSMTVREIAFLANGQDLTRPYSKLHHDASGTSYINSPVYLVDGDLSTIYEDYRMCPAGGHTIGSGTRDRVQISLEYPECKVFDSYRWAPVYSSSTHYALNPTAWRVFGGFSPSGGDLLSQVTDYVVAEGDDGWTQTNFALTCPVSPSLHVGTLALSSGVKVDATGAQVSCDTLSGSANNVELDLSSGAVLPITANQSVSKISVDLTKDLATVGVIKAEANGALYVTGDSQLMAGPLLYASSEASGSHLRSWSVYLNGELTERHPFYDVETGAVRLQPLATLIMVK